MSTAEEAPAAPTAKRPDHENEVLPWSVVFAFASGSDAANAMATTKSTSRGTLFSDDKVSAGLNLRLEKSEAGKMILNQLSSPPKGRFWLPKLMHCAENNLYCQSNGLYITIPDGRKSYNGHIRFYNDKKQVISVTSIGKPRQIWRWFKRGERNFRPADARYEWIRAGPNVLRVSFIIKTDPRLAPPGKPKIDYTGVLRRDGILALNRHSHINDNSGSIDYRFISCVSDEW